MKELVLASGNAGKIREFEAMLGPLGYSVIPQGALEIADAEEPHGTFVENALAKARHASRLSGRPALADDSGICARALGGAPGVYSARYAGDAPAGGPTGREANDARNNAKLIAALAGTEDRSAHYLAVIVLLRHADDPEPLIAEGRWHGRIIDTPRGANGFGYDPYFLLPEEGKTAAELDPARKNAVSHRGKALQRLLALLRENT
jgi:XTP/dITP diphosphohydrolase